MSGVLLLGAAPAWADDSPVTTFADATLADVEQATGLLPVGAGQALGLLPDADVLRTVPDAGRPMLGGLGGALPVVAYRDAPAFTGMPLGGLPTRAIPDDGVPPAPVATPTAAPAVTPTAGIASISAPPPVSLPDAQAPVPTASPRPAFAEQRRKAPALPAADDPRLLEEPIDGFVNREKWKK